MANKPLQLRLKVLWIKDFLGFAVDQVDSEEKYALTPYYLWPKTEAWEQLKLKLDSKCWLAQEDKTAILKTTSDVMEYWLLYRDNKTVKNFKDKFKEVEIPTLDLNPDEIGL